MNAPGATTLQSSKESCYATLMGSALVVSLVEGRIAGDSVKFLSKYPNQGEQGRQGSSL